MDIIPDLLTEVEFREFDFKTYQAMANILDDTIAKHIKDYCNNPDADPKIVSDINEFLGSYVENFTFHYELKERGIIDLVRTLTPETLLLGNVDLDDVYEKLTFLEQNEDKLRSFIPSRTKEAYTAFLSELRAVVSRLSSKGIKTAYPDLIGRVEANKFVFYVPNSKGHYTGTSVIHSKRRQWTMCLRGIQYDRYCKENGINYSKRRVF